MYTHSGYGILTRGLPGTSGRFIRGFRLRGNAAAVASRGLTAGYADAAPPLPPPRQRSTTFVKLVRYKRLAWRRFGAKRTARHTPARLLRTPPLASTTSYRAMPHLQHISLRLRNAKQRTGTGMPVALPLPHHSRPILWLAPLQTHYSILGTSQLSRYSQHLACCCFILTTASSRRLSGVWPRFATTAPPPSAFRPRIRAAFLFRLTPYAHFPTGLHIPWLFILLYLFHFLYTAFTICIPPLHTMTV